MKEVDTGDTNLPVNNICTYNKSVLKKKKTVCPGDEVSECIFVKLKVTLTGTGCSNWNCGASEPMHLSGISRQPGLDKFACSYEFVTFAFF